MLAAHFCKGFVGALYDPLAADIDPRAGRHLPEHHEAFAVQFAKVFPGRPCRYEVGVGDQHTRGVFVCAKHADRFAGLHEQVSSLSSSFNLATMASKQSQLRAALPMPP